MKVLITGSNGQMGQAYQLAPDFSQNEFFFATRDVLDILNFSQLETFLRENLTDYVINFAAYTNVEKAEEEESTAYENNVIGARNLAILCHKYDVGLIHLSTDYVFDGKSSVPYRENDETIPLQVYGKTKLEGEKEIIKNASRYVILRTSWVYSNYANNFYLKMLELSQRSSELYVVEDQIGSPTSSIELCRAIDAILHKGITLENSGVYHFSGRGMTSWKDFATEIFYQSEVPVIVHGVTSKYYGSNVERPAFSYLSSEKFSSIFEYTPLHWKMALTEVIADRHISPIKVGFRTIINDTEFIIASIDWSKEIATLFNIDDMQTYLELPFSQIIVQNR